MSVVVVVASFKFKPGSEDEGVGLLKGVIEATHGEPGCRLYALHRVLDDPTRFAIVEKWDSQDDLDAHFRQPHMAAISGAVDLLEEPPQVWFTESVAVGDAAKGAL